MGSLVEDQAKGGRPEAGLFICFLKSVPEIIEKVLREWKSTVANALLCKCFPEGRSHCSVPRGIRAVSRDGQHPSLFSSWNLTCTQGLPSLLPLGPLGHSLCLQCLFSQE